MKKVQSKEQLFDFETQMVRAASKGLRKHWHTSLDQSLREELREAAYRAAKSVVRDEKEKILQLARKEFKAKVDGAIKNAVDEALKQLYVGTA